MRLVTTLIAAAGFPGFVLAHELPPEAGELAQLAHHTLSLHHLPALVLIAVGGIILWRRQSNADRRRED